MTPPQEQPSNSGQVNMPWGQQGSQPQRLASRPTSAPGQRPTTQAQYASVRPVIPQFAGFYPQFSAGYPMQYFSQSGQWRPIPPQQAASVPLLPRPQGPRAPFSFPTGQAYPFQQGSQQARGRQPYRGQSSRQPEPNRGRGRGQYRAMWQEVTQVGHAHFGSCQA